jgi:hypothetical protein
MVAQVIPATVHSDGEWGPSVQDFWILCSDGALLISNDGRYSHITTLPDASPAFRQRVQKVFNEKGEDLDETADPQIYARALADLL